MLTIGLDVGGTGARAALARDGVIIATTSTDRPTRIGSGGVDAANAVAVLTPLVRELVTDRPAPIDAVGAGLTGFALLGDELRVRLPQALAEAAETPVVVLCSDML
ncbi:hypothetical protein AB0M47_42245, partial [Hamadaea sp. NPDC051192]|uniref:hypothetical protein n=1 Tax=Hamadaea sp. NPDC051192 TaxID=3154940 RepID=UPI0034139378